MSETYNPSTRPFSENPLSLEKAVAGKVGDLCERCIYIVEGRCENPQSGRVGIPVSGSSQACDQKKLEWQ